MLFELVTAFAHGLLFLLSAAIIWFFAGRLLDSVDRVARRLGRSGFTVAFFVLGFLTSIGELSLMVNSTISTAPQVSAGNLVGASVVILLFIVPFLAIVGDGVRLTNTLNRPELAVALLSVGLPALSLVDGDATRTEGLMCVLAYVTLLYLVRRRSASVPEVVEQVAEALVHKRRSPALDGANIALGAVLIFVGGNVLVDETVYFSVLLGVPSSIIGLLVLSIGTNIPELVIAVRSVGRARKDLAFGNYVGSAVANTLIFGALALANGPFAVERSQFVFSAAVMTIGLAGFYVFAGSQSRISRREGVMLAALYGAFAVFQLANLVRFATD